MRILSVSRALVLFAAVSPLFGQASIAPGDGAPNEYIRTLFTNAYYRGNFSQLAGAASGNVRSFGTGLIQEFADSTRSSGKLALVKATSLGDPENPFGGVYQVSTDLYAYYSSVGTTTAGYPTSDTANCTTGGCQYQIFSNNVALFVYPSATSAAPNITLRDPFYSKWLFFGGMSGLGPAISAETVVTSEVNVSNQATVQTFVNGRLFNVTAGTLNGRFVSVHQPVYALYTTSLGFPLAEEIILPNGNRRQSFENGSIEYDSTGAAVLRAPIYSIGLILKDTTLRLNLGDTVTVRARAVAADGTELTDRPVTFVSSNSRVALVTYKGLDATIKAVGGGTANITATAEGKSTPALTVIVTAPCCQIGEGAPTAAAQQAFQDVIARTRLSVHLPGAERVRRVGNGYVQGFVSSDTSATRYLLALADRSGQAYVVSGALLNRYEDLGGPAGALGYPVADATLSGRQLFEGGVLAGNPVRVVSAPILAKWAMLNYEGGVLGEPTAEAGQVLSFAGSAGVSQVFRTGIVVASSKGAFAAVGASFNKYVSLNGPAGPLGLPTSDEFTSGGVRHQDFEGGGLDTPSGAVEAAVTFKERKPSVISTPAAVSQGSRVRLTVSGFSDGASLRVSVTGQPDFVVKTQTGSYAWDVAVAANAAAGVIKVRAVDTANLSSAAEAAYTIRSLAELKAQIVKLSGDTQSGIPGLLLPVPLRISVRDENGNPLTGTSVRFNASPGAEVNPVSTLTDSQGMAETKLKLPAVEGVAVVSVEAARQVATFSARVASSTLTGYPKLLALADSGGNGALLAASASAVRYYQDRQGLGSPSGLAEVASLGQFLKTLCATDVQGQQVCDGLLAGGAVNLWRLGVFTGGGLDIVPVRPELGSIREASATGSPVIIALRLQNGTADAVLHAVVAIGVNGDGSVQIHDPNASLAQTNLGAYLNGFGGWKATLTGAAQVIARQPSPSAFLVETSSNLFLQSPAGECGVNFELLGVSRQRVCGGDASEYQLDLSGSGTIRATVTDLGESGGSLDLRAGSSASFRISRPGTSLAVVPQQLAVAQRSVVNGATFTPDIAPGSVISIFGAGLAKTGETPRISLGESGLTVALSTPFQVNAVIPTGVSPGTYSLRITSSYGTTEIPVTVVGVAPQAFRVAGNRAAVLNADGNLNTPSAPARRGETLAVYGTGFGAVVPRGTLSETESPVVAVVGGRELAPSFAGLAPGFVGLYQVNVALPSDLAPGLQIPMTLRQRQVESTAWEIAVQ